MEKEAINITNHFFNLGAVISKQDYDYVLKKLNRVIKKEREKILKELEKSSLAYTEIEVFKNFINTE